LKINFIILNSHQLQPIIHRQKTACILGQLPSTILQKAAKSSLIYDIIRLSQIKDLEAQYIFEKTEKRKRIMKE